MQRPFLLISALFAGLMTITAASAQSQPANTELPAADNTASNAKDRETSATTPMDQSNDKAAIQVTAAIRRAVISDKSLSSSAHNVKIVTEGDIVTIRGPVASAEEKQRVESLALKSAPGKQVRNQLSIAD